MEFEDKWKSDALAYIERENSDERQAYLQRIARFSASRVEFVEATTPQGVLVEAVRKINGNYAERWRMTFNGVVVTYGGGLDVAFADIAIGVGGHEWDCDLEVPELPFKL